MKINKRLATRLRETGHLDFSRLIKKDFADARLSPRDAHDYLVDEIRRDYFNKALVRGGIAASGAILASTIALSFALYKANYPIPYHVGACCVGTTVARKVFDFSKKGYSNFSKFREGYYNEVRVEANITRELRSGVSSFLELLNKSV